MKKMSAIFAFLCVFSAAAMAADVYSVNAVGYYTVTLPPNGQFIMVGSAFDPVGGDTNTSRTLVDIFGSNSGLRQSEDRTAVDKVILWNFAGQRYATFGQHTNGMFASTQNSTTWGIATNPVLPRGYGFFIQSLVGSSNSTVLTLSGQVPTALTNTLSIVGDATSSPFQMLMNPYPVARSLDSLINTNHGAVASQYRTDCDKVILWDTAGQKYSTLGLKAPTNRWNYTTSNATWTNTIPDITIQPGVAFWYLSKTNFIWQSDKTYNWP